MGFWRRFNKIEERFEPIRVALVGDDSLERRLLESAYQQTPKAKIVFSSGAEELDKMLTRNQPELVEIFASPEKRADLALRCLEGGVNVSTGMPPALELDKLKLLKEKAERREKLLRVRNHLLYYQPYQKALELLVQEKIGYAMMLKMIVKRNQIPEGNLDYGKWLLEKESDYLTLAEYFYGPIEKLFASPGLTKNKSPGSILLGFKFKTRHRFGYLLLDFAPELKIRTFTEPVFRQVWLTGTAGVIMVNRGEGQLWRVSPLLLRAKNYSHTYEALKDNWEDIYPAMVEEIWEVLRKGKPLFSRLELAERGIQLALASRKSLEECQEILI